MLKSGVKNGSSKSQDYLMMKWFKLFICFMCLLAGCSGSRYFKQKTEPPDRIAYNAVKSFNKAFYNEDKQLYNETTKKDQPAAIWTQAIFLEMIMDAFEKTDDPEYRKQVNDIIQGGYEEYDEYNWNNKKVWFIYDDMMWWINALARAYKITNNKKYLDWSEKGFKRVWNSAYDKKHGGMFWQFKRRAKNACINYPTVIAALRLYHITNNGHYLDKAKLVYQWSKENLFNRETGRVGDHKLGDHPVGWEDYTYNQGACIGAASMLYEITKDSSYLKDARLAADYTKEVMCNAAGILPPEGSWNEQGVLKTIFVHYMMLFIEKCDQDQYLSWLQKNAEVAWKHRDTKRNLTCRNYMIRCAGEISSYDASSAVALFLLCNLPEK